MHVQINCKEHKAMNSRIAFIFGCFFAHTAGECFSVLWRGAPSGSFFWTGTNTDTFLALFGLVACLVVFMVVWDSAKSSSSPGR